MRHLGYLTSLRTLSERITMNTKISDVYLTLLAAGSCVGSVVAAFGYHALASPFKQIVFATVFLSPALLLHSTSQLLRKNRSVPIISCLLFSAVGLAFWVLTVRMWMSGA